MMMGREESVGVENSGRIGGSGRQRGEMVVGGLWRG